MEDRAVFIRFSDVSIDSVPLDGTLGDLQPISDGLGIAHPSDFSTSPQVIGGPHAASSPAVADLTALQVVDPGTLLLGASPDAGRLIVAAVKRAFDIVIGCLILLVVAPAMATIALCVVLESPGPVFYRARRVGWCGERLDILKFRKMRNGATGRPLTLVEDERFTRIGRFLARTKLDELPQLVNVLRGEMSLIGPRPEDPGFVERHAKAFEAILQVRPGITGLSQLAYRAESRILDPDDPVGDYEQRVLPQKLYLDRLYVERRTSLLDLRILAWTIAATIGIPVSVNRSTASIRPRLSRGGRRERAAAHKIDPQVSDTTVAASMPDTTGNQV